MSENRAQSWKRKATTLNLPSGRDCEVIDPQAMMLIMEDGDVPGFLAAGALTISQGGQVPINTAEPTPEDLSKLSKIMKRVVAAALVSPIVVPAGRKPNYDNNEIAIEDVDGEDITYIFSWATGGTAAAQAMTNFLNQQGEGVQSP